MSDFLDRISKLSPQRLALLADELNERVQASEKNRRVPLAIVGIGCRLPGGVEGPDAYWQLLREGIDAIQEVPASRWDSAELYDRDPEAAGKMNTRWGGFIDAPEQFDPKFFGIAPAEAIHMDPQQRLLLETAWEALEHAGIPASSLTGTPTGVFLGICNADYGHIALHAPRETITPYLASGLSHAVAAGRISYVLGLQGPSLAIDTSCSASLVAVHLACQSLRLGECNAALAGGVNLILNPDITIALSQSRMMASDGRCKAFSDAADGFVRGEGCGMILLKRLPDAIRDRNRILAVIRGSACNQDGRSSGLTAPNGPSQEAVIAAALSDAGLRPNDVDYIEAHGTGTSLGDPIEAGALNAVFANRSPVGEPLRLGSVKTNLGHLESAAGIAGLIKLVLSIQHGQIPASLHLETPNRRIEWDRLPLAIPTQLATWERRGKTRIGGVSSFGFSGTNAHVVVEEYAARSLPASLAGQPWLFTLSAKTGTALKTAAARLRRHLVEDPSLALGDVAHTLNAGRAHFEHRAALVAHSHSALVESLNTFAQPNKASGIRAGRTVAHSPRIAFVFGEHESFEKNMARELYEAVPVFRESLRRCEEILKDGQEALGGGASVPLTSLFYPETGGKLSELPPGLVQASSFALHYALAEVWRSCGVHPSAVLGHGIGEYAAACVAGVFSLKDGLRLALAKERGDAADFEACVRQITYHSPRIPFLPNSSGQSAEAAGVDSAEYWLSRLRSTNLSPSALASLGREGCSASLYMGSDSALKQLAQAAATELPGKWLTSLDTDHHDLLRVLDTAASLYVLGCEPNMSRLYGDGVASTVTLPTYPFERECYWLDIEDRSSRLQPGALAKASSVRGDSTSLASNDRVDQSSVPASDDTDGWVYDLAWEPKPLPANLPPEQVEAFAEDLIERLVSPPTSEVLLRVTDLTSQLEPIYATYILEVLRELGLDAFRQPDFSMEELSDTLKIMPARRRQMDRLLGILVEDGLAIRTGDRFRFVELPQRPQADGELQRLDASYPECRIEINILRRCAKKLGAVLRGTYDPMQLVFADGSIEETEQIYQNSPVCRYFNGVARDLIRTAVSQIAGRTVRLLEIGAGTGATTASVLPDIADKNIEYTFTDISPVFLAKAASKFSYAPSVRYRLLNVESDPIAQGFEPGGYDIILAANVLHATADLRRTVLHASKLLAPGGLLLLVEGVRPDRWLDLTLGLTDGWWRFHDHDLRPDHPLVSADIWRRLMDEVGLNTSRAISYVTRDGSLSQQVLIVARAGAAAQPTSADTPSRRWILFADELGVGTALNELLIHAGEACEIVRRPHSNSEIDAEFARIESRLANTPAEIVYLWGIDASPSGSALADAGDTPATEVERCSTVLIHLIQTLLRSTSSARHLWIATRGAQPTASFSPDLGGAVQSLAWGIGRVFGLEAPEQFRGLVDLDPAMPPESAAARLLEELLASTMEDQVAYRGGERLVARLQHSNLRDAASDAPAFAGLRADGSYLIVGGLGGVGLRLSRWVAEQRPGHLILLGRTGAQPGSLAAERRKAIQEIEELGGKVTVVAGDVASHAEMKLLFGRFGADLPPLRGVFHVATTLNHAAIADLTDDQVETMLRPKVGGIVVLHELTKNLDLDFFLAFSSTASLLGAKGMATYAAANQFIDCFAHSRRAEGLPMMSINWGAWDVIRAASSEEVARLSHMGLLPMPSAKALGVLAKLIPSARAQVMLANVDWETLKPSYEVRRVRPLLERLGVSRPNEPGAKTLAASPSLSLPSMLGATPEDSERSIEAFVLVQAAQVLGFRGGELPPLDVPLTDMGLDSLMAVDLRNRLQKALGQELSPTVVFDYPTVSRMVGMLGTMLWAARGSGQKDRILAQEEEIRL